uniref:COMM domain containing 7 n=1 Tax=Xiphophorus couchianus TaxID=32473 RepID=A0A3B5MSN1_9TELE
MQLHFAKDVLPDSVGTDFQNLNKFNEQQFSRLIEILFQFLLDPKETDRFVQQLTEFAGEHGMSAGPLRNLMKSVLLVPQGGRNYRKSAGVSDCLPCFKTSLKHNLSHNTYMQTTYITLCVCVCVSAVTYATVPGRDVPCNRGETGGVRNCPPSLLLFGKASARFLCLF